MTAKEAREKAKRCNEANEAKDYDKVIKIIHKASESGKFEITIIDEVLEFTINLLVGNGYKIEQISDGRNGIDTKISWNHE